MPTRNVTSRWNELLLLGWSLENECMWNFLNVPMEFCIPTTRWCSFAHRNRIGGHRRGVVSKNFKDQCFQWSKRWIVVTTLFAGDSLMHREWEEHRLGQWKTSSHKKKFSNSENFRNSRLEKTGHRVPSRWYLSEHFIWWWHHKKWKTNGAKNGQTSQNRDRFFFQSWLVLHPLWNPQQAATKNNKEGNSRDGRYFNSNIPKTN